MTDNKLIKTINDNFSLFRNEINNMNNSLKLNETAIKNSQRETSKSLNSINNLLLQLLIGQNKLIDLAKKNK